MKNSKATIKQVLALRERNMTYAEIAKRIGVSIPTIGNWLRANKKTKTYNGLDATSHEQITAAIKALRVFRTALTHI